MFKHTRTGCTTVRLVDPDERVEVVPFAAPAMRYRNPGPLLRAVVEPTRPDQAIGRAPAKAHEKPS